MRKSRRTILRVFGIGMLLVLVLGGFAATGNLPPLNRWIERRLLAELRTAGLETDATHLRELSWRRAVVGPVSLQAPGLSVQLAEARAELGWRVLTGRLAPRLVLRGLTADLDLTRRSEVAGAAIWGGDGGFPEGGIDVETGRLVLRNGAKRIEVPFTGFVETGAETMRATLVADAPAFSGRVTLRRSPAGALEVAVREGSFGAEDWRGLLAEGLFPSLVALRCGPDGRIRISVTGRIAAGRWSAVRCDADLPALGWSEGARTIELGAAKLNASFENDAAWRVGWRADRGGWSDHGWRLEIQEPELVAEPGTARLQFAQAVLKGAGVDLTGGGDVVVRSFFGQDPMTAEASVRLADGAAHGWRLIEPAAVRAQWSGVELTLTLPSLVLDGPGRVQLAAVEATLGGVREGHPRLVAQGQGACELGRLLGAKGAEWQFEPAMTAAKIAVNATLAAGAEAARVEFSVPAMRRTCVFPGGRFEAVIGGEAVVNLDGTHVSGRAAIDAHEIIARRGSWSVLAPEVTFGLRWPRVWRAGAERWSRESFERVWREVLWAGDYDLKTSEAIVRRGECEWCATGVAAQLRSRGAELHETGGVEVGITAGELADGAGLRATGLSADAVLGLEGGKVRLAGEWPELALKAGAEQTLNWADTFEAEGTFGFDPVTLSGKEPLARWWPALREFEFSGGVGLSGTSRYAGGAWSFGGDLLMKDLNVSWPVRKAAVEGLRGRIAWSGPQWRTAPEQALTYQHASFGGLELVNGSATFGLEPSGMLTVGRFASGALGGEIECTPFEVDLRHPELDTRLSLRAVRLEQLLELTENVPADAEGAMDGSIPLRWSEGRLGVGTGYLRLTPGELGRMHFTRDLRLLTSGRKPGGMEYKALRQIEESMLDLVFDRLQIDLYPKDAAGQSARIRLVGVPSEGEQRMPVSLDVNVNAPLAHFLKWGRALSISAWGVTP